MPQIFDNLYIKDISATDEEEAQYLRESTEVDFLINLSGRYTGEADIFYPLKDGKMKQARFDGAVINVVDRLQEGDTVCVNCAAGVSRSVGVAATAKAHIDNQTFMDALSDIVSEYPKGNPHDSISSHGKTFLNERNNCVVTFDQKTRQD